MIVTNLIPRTMNYNHNLNNPNPNSNNNTNNNINSINNNHILAYNHNEVSTVNNNGNNFNYSQAHNVKPDSRYRYEEPKVESIDDLCSMFSNITTNKYNLKDAVKLPLDEDPGEWIAYNMNYFHKQICMLFGTINESCKCAKMTAGKYEYSWSSTDSVDIHYKNKFNAKQYINHLLDWVQEQLDDDDVFPSSSLEKRFPDDFMDVCRLIARRLMRVFAHCYSDHLKDIRELKQEAHTNTSLKHFIYFCQEFKLLSTQDMIPMREHIDNLT